eukprot:gene1260-11347_t
MLFVNILDKTTLGKQTSEVESFHSVKNRFSPKGSNDGSNLYRLKPYIAALYWNMQQYNKDLIM